MAEMPKSPDGGDDKAPPTVKRPGGGTLPDVKRPGGGTLPDVKRPGGGTLPDVDRPGGGTLPDVKRPGGGTLPDVKRPGGSDGKTLPDAVLTTNNDRNIDTLAIILATQENGGLPDMQNDAEKQAFKVKLTEVTDGIKNSLKGKDAKEQAKILGETSQKALKAVASGAIPDKLVESIAKKFNQGPEERAFVNEIKEAQKTAKENEKILDEGMKKFKDTTGVAVPDDVKKAAMKLAAEKPKEFKAVVEKLKAAEKADDLDGIKNTLKASGVLALDLSNPMDRAFAAVIDGKGKEGGSSIPNLKGGPAKDNGISFT